LIETKTPRPEAILLLEREQTRLLRSCLLLEAMADSLPSGFKQEHALLLLKDTEAALQRHITLQEQVIFPQLRSASGEGAQIERILHQLEYEHSSDSALIIEIIESAMTLELFARTAQVERFGCLLRHFFEGHRRHCAWETQILSLICQRRPPPSGYDKE
jgi:iron-sulfur cluster repair protein YtfE (RIC family)